MKTQSAILRHFILAICPIISFGCGPNDSFDPSNPIPYPENITPTGKLAELTLSIPAGYQGSLDPTYSETTVRCQNKPPTYKLKEGTATKVPPGDCVISVEHKFHNGTNQVYSAYFSAKINLKSGEKRVYTLGVITPDFPQQYVYTTAGFPMQIYLTGENGFSNQTLVYRYQDPSLINKRSFIVPPGTYNVTPYVYLSSKLFKQYATDVTLAEGERKMAHLPLKDHRLRFNIHFSDGNQFEVRDQVQMGTRTMSSYSSSEITLWKTISASHSEYVFPSEKALVRIATKCSSFLYSMHPSQLNDTPKVKDINIRTLNIEKFEDGSDGYFKLMSKPATGSPQPKYSYCTSLGYVPLGSTIYLIENPRMNYKIEFYTSSKQFINAIEL